VPKDTLSSKLAVIYKMQGIALRELGRHKDAFDSIEKCIDTVKARGEEAAHPAGYNSTLVTALVEKGLALHEMGRLDEAVRAFDDAIARVSVVGQTDEWKASYHVAGAYIHKSVSLAAAGASELAVSSADEGIRRLETLVRREGLSNLEKSLAGAYTT